MHAEAREAVRQYAVDTGLHMQPGLRVLDIGGRLINGHVRDLIAPGGHWTTLDLAPDPSVDIVADARTWRAETPEYDLVICTEVLEHVDDWQGVLAACHSAVRSTGAVIVTCGSTGRGVHSCTGQAELEPGEHYGNVSEQDLRRELEKLFLTVYSSYRPVACDAYALARDPR